MTMNYSIQNTAGDELATRSNKGKAVEVAQAHRADTGEGVRVLTAKGTVVLELAGKRRIKMSKPYTRVVPLPEGVEVPDGMRVAYFRPRRNAAVLHDAEAGEYRILNTKSGKLRSRVFATTRDAGRALVDA